MLIRLPWWCNVSLLASSDKDPWFGQLSGQKKQH